MNADYTNSFKINRNAEEVFTCLTQKIPQWWTSSFQGSAEKTGESFTVNFGETYKTFYVKELIPNEKITWICTDAHIDMAALNRKDEWKNTEIVWNILQQDFGVLLSITHKGLTPETECYDVCEKGWATFLSSLFTLLESGSGLPYEGKK